jgi:hypothetical protein
MMRLSSLVHKKTSEKQDDPALGVEGLLPQSLASAILGMTLAAALHATPAVTHEQTQREDDHPPITGT